MPFALVLLKALLSSFDAAQGCPKRSGAPHCPFQFVCSFCLASMRVLRAYKLRFVGQRVQTFGLSR